MKIKNVYYTSKFERNFKNLPRNVQKKAAGKEKLFREDPYYSILKTHRLKGHMGNFHSFSVDYRYRIVFAFEDGDEVTFVDIGDHSIYRWDHTAPYLGQPVHNTDFNSDGRVDCEDFAILQSNYSPE